jgi:hypothetical protein
MTAVPAETPVTSPVLVFTVATAVLLLLHVPPVAVFERVVVPFEHKVVFPVIGARGLTVTVVVSEQPVDIV